MKTFVQFILEARGEQAQRIAVLRRQANEAMRRGDMVEYRKLAELINRFKEKETESREANVDVPVHKSAQTAPNAASRGKGATFKDTPVSSAGTEANVRRDFAHNIRTGKRVARATPSDVMTTGLHGDTGSTSQGGGNVPVRNKGIDRSGGRIGGR